MDEEITSLGEYSRPWARLIRHGDPMDNTIRNVEWIMDGTAKWEGCVKIHTHRNPVMLSRA